VYIKYLGEINMTNGEIRQYCKDNNVSKAEAYAYFNQVMRNNLANKPVKSKIVKKLMSTHKASKEIKKPVGLYIGYKPKNHKEGDTYSTWRLVGDYDNIMESKRMLDRDGLTREDLALALWEYFRNDKYQVDMNGNCIEDTHALATAVMAYLTTYNGFVGANTGYLMTVKEWDPTNPNGAKHGGIRLKANGFEKHTSFEDWNTWTAENQNDDAEIRSLFDGCFAMEDAMADGTIIGI
jgi:hypothetical protein